MSEKQPTLFDLEDAILRLGTLGRILIQVGAPRGVVDAEGVNLLGQLVEESANTLKEQWCALVRAEGGQL